MSVLHTRPRLRLQTIGLVGVLAAASAIVLASGPAQASPAGVAATPGGITRWAGCTANPPGAAQSGVVQVGGHIAGSVALKYDGSVVGWDGLTVPAAASTGAVKVAVGADGFQVLKADGTVVDGSGSTVVAAGSGIKDFELSGSKAIGVKDDGSAVVWDTGWGYDIHDLGSTPASVSSPGSGVTSVGAGDYAMYAVKNGAVVAWGNNGNGQATPPASASSGVTAVAGGSHHAVALKSDGSVIAWGNNTSGQSNVPAAASSGVVAIAAGDAYSLALKSDGSTLVWGSGSCGLTVSPPGSGVTALPSGRVKRGYAVTGASGPSSLGGTLTSAPTVSKRPGTAIQDVFYLDSNSQVIHNTLTKGVLGTAENLGGIMKSGSSVAAVSRTSDRIDIFTRGTEDALWQNSFDGTSWSGWAARSSAGHLTSSPTVASWGANRLDVFAKGTGNDLQHTAWDSTACGGWCSFGWESLGGTLTTGPAAVSWGAARIDIFAGGGGNALHQKVFDGGSGWSGWLHHGGSLTSAPTVSSQATNQLDIYARNAGNGLSSLHFGGGYWGWSSWQDRGSLSSANGSAPASSSFVTGNKAVYFRGTDNALWQRLY